MKTCWPTLKTVPGIGIPYNTGLDTRSTVTSWYSKFVATTVVTNSIMPLWLTLGGDIKHVSYIVTKQNIVVTLHDEDQLSDYCDSLPSSPPLWKPQCHFIQNLGIHIYNSYLNGWILLILTVQQIDWCLRLCSRKERRQLTWNPSKFYSDCTSYSSGIFWQQKRLLSDFTSKTNKKSSNSHIDLCL